MIVSFAVDWSWLETGVGVVAGGLITYFAVRYQATMEASREQKEQEEQRKADEAERHRIGLERASSAHWRAAARLLKGALFAEIPESVAAQTIERMLEYFERGGTRLSERLFRAARLFVESRVFRAAQGERLEPLTAASVEDALTVLRTPLDSVLASLDSPPTQTFATCFQLAMIDAAATAPKASTYFQALADVEGAGAYSEAAAGEHPGERWRSLTKIAVKDGFVAPTYLIGGLLKECEEDWQALLRGFGVNVPKDASAFIRVQRFEFYCWLLWGPSIPACECDAWDGSFIALQYGYGDENNSFPLLLERKLYRSGWVKLRASMQEDAERPRAPAIGAEFTGTLVWGPRVGQGRTDVPAIYHVPIDRRRLKKDDAQAQPVFKGLMLRAETIEPLDARRLYYSAYVWIMFEACSPAMEPLYRKPEDRWKFLLPIFEHANIADGDTLEFLKARLAEKAWSAVAALERSGEVRFRYTCAFDDPGSVHTEGGNHRLRFHLDAGNSVRAHRLRDLLAGSVLLSEGFHDMPDAGDAHALEAAMRQSAACSRLFSRPARDEAIITSCSLPEIVEAFYQSSRADRIV
jgi:hypothetical protein